MKADPVAQRRLVDLQDLDTALARLDHAKRTLPEIKELIGLKSKRDQIGDALVAAETRKSDAELALKRAEDDLVPVRERKAKDQAMVDAGQGDPKALSAMIDEIAHLGKRISDLEDVQLEAMEELEAATVEWQSIKQEHDDLTAKGRALVAARDVKVADLEAEASGLRERRTCLAAEVPADLMARYDKLASRLGGRAVGVLQGARCTGCGLEANSADMARYKAAAPDDLLTCEECGRILVRR